MNIYAKNISIKKKRNGRVTNGILSSPGPHFEGPPLRPGTLTYFALNFMQLHLEKVVWINAVYSEVLFIQALPLLGKS